MAELKLLRGQITFVDDQDLPKLAGYRWLLSTLGYVIARVWDGKKCQTVWLHRLILGTPAGVLTDHIDGNPLNNRRSNLRQASARENSRNKKKQRNGRSSSFKGVYWHAAGKGYWRSRLAYRDENGNYRAKHLGLFEDETEAAKAYDTAAKEHFGKFALLNFQS